MTDAIVEPAQRSVAPVLSLVNRFLGPRGQARRNRARQRKLRQRRLGFWQGAVEALEPRLLLAADLIYSEGTPPNTFDPDAIAAYAAGLVSTNFTLRAEQDGGNLFWRLYGTGTDVLTIPATQVLQYPITQASDLDVNVTRDNNGAEDIVLGLGLKDFVGDRLTIDMDSLSVLNGQFAGTTIDIDFAGGKDVDLGAIVGVVLPSPSTILDDQMVLAGTVAGGAIQHDVLIHSSSDIADIANAPNPPATAAVATVSGDLTVKSDSRIVLGAGLSLTANNITLAAEASSTGGLVKGILADATSAVSVDSVALTANGGTVRLEAKSTVDVNEDGDNFFSNGLSVTVVTSFNQAAVDVLGNSTITADQVVLDAFVNGSITATPNSSTFRVIEVLTGSDARVHVGDTANITGTTSVDAKAHTDVTINAYATPGSSNNDANFDAAIVNVNVLNSPLDNTFTSGSDVVIDGSAQINNAGGTTTLRADDKLLLTSEADGNVVGTAGATLAVNTITNLQTLGRISGAATVNAATVHLEAESHRNVAAKASSTPGGATGNQAPAGSSTSSGNTLSTNNAKTSDGAITIAGAVAVNVLGTLLPGATPLATSAAIDSSSTTTAATVNVKSKATDAVSAVATGENTSSGSFGVAIGVAINTADYETESWLGGTSTIAAGTVNVTAEGDADNAKDGVFDPAATVVDTAADTMDLGLVAAAKFATADEVTYDNGGGTNIGGLTDDGGTTKYFVIHRQRRRHGHRRPDRRHQVLRDPRRRRQDQARQFGGRRCGGHGDRPDERGDGNRPQAVQRQHALRPRDLRRQ